MEVEVKYAIPSEEVLETIWSDRELTAMSDFTSAERLPFYAVYYDTADGMLAENRTTLRIRAEGDTAFMTMKWDSVARGALHRREEVNIPVSRENCFNGVPFDLLKQSPKGAEIVELLGDTPLNGIIKMRFVRSRKRLNFEGNKIELALDCGEILTDAGICPILEMELEHYAGPSEESVEALGKILAEKYSLQPELRSKYSRGLALLNESKEG